jgi:hypothetical protein
VLELGIPSFRVPTADSLEAADEEETSQMFLMHQELL